MRKILDVITSRDINFGATTLCDDASLREFFEGYWKAKGYDVTIPLKLRYHTLSAVTPPNYDDQSRNYSEVKEATIRPAVLGELSQLVDWYLEFTLSGSHRPGREEAEKYIATHIKFGRLFVLTVSRNGVPVVVSLASKTRVSSNYHRIALVFTPEVERRKGFAEKIVRTLAYQCLQESGNDGGVGLFTDIENPTSNAVYYRVGFRPIYDAIDYKVRGEKT